MRYESLVLIGKPNRVTIACQAVAILTTLSFFPKLICDILYACKIIQSRSYLNPTIAVFFVFVALGILV